MAYRDRAHPLPEQIDLPGRTDALLAYRYYTGRKELVKRIALLTREGDIFLGRDTYYRSTLLYQKMVELLSQQARSLGLPQVRVRRSLVCPECGLLRPRCLCRSGS